MTVQILIDGEIIVEYVDEADVAEYVAGQVVVGMEAKDDQNL